MKVQNNEEFWKILDNLVAESEIVIDRPKGSFHPKYPNMVYKLDYGYLKNSTSMDGEGIDVWIGSNKNRRLDAIICIVDYLKKDSEIKILLGCTEEEKKIAIEMQTRPNMRCILIKR